MSVAISNSIRFLPLKIKLDSRHLSHSVCVHACMHSVVVTSSESESDMLSSNFSCGYFHINTLGEWALE